MKLPINYNELDYKQRSLVRSQYIKNQKGLCYYCKENLQNPASDDVMGKSIKKQLFPVDFFKLPVHLHYTIRQE